MSKRSKRRRDPGTAGEADAAETRRAAEADPAASGGRPGRAGQADSGGRGGRPDQAGQADSGGPGRPGETRRAGRGGRGDRSAAPARRPGRSAGRPAASSWGLGVQLAFPVAVFAIFVLVAELAGAANLGVAFGIGQIGFAIAVIYLLVRR
jgi:hypothetical protein